MKYYKYCMLALGAALLGSCQAVDGTLADLGVNEPVFESSAQIPESEALIGGGQCPRVKVVNELSALSEFTNMENPRENEMISRAHVAAVDSTCQYGPRSVTVDVQLAFESMLGPHGRVQSSDKPFFSYPFFIAVSEPNGEILAKEIFSASITFQPGENQQNYMEKLRQIIPVPNQARGGRYQVLVGFQLSDEQLRYNRGVIKGMKDAERSKSKSFLGPLKKKTDLQSSAILDAVDKEPLDGSPQILAPAKR